MQSTKVQRQKEESRWKANYPFNISVYLFSLPYKIQTNIGFNKSKIVVMHTEIFFFLFIFSKKLICPSLKYISCPHLTLLDDQTAL